MKVDHKSGPGRVADGVPHFDKQAGDEDRDEISPAGEGQFSLAFAHAPIGMAIFGLDQRLHRANSAFCKMLGYNQRELLEHTLLDFTHPDDRKKDKALAGQLLRGGIPSYRLEKRCLKRDGREVWLDVTALLVRDSQNEPLYGLAMVEDITERKRAEEALRASEERYRSFVVNSSEGIWRFEAGQPIDTSLSADEQLEMLSEHGYLAECNDAMARMYGCERADDLVGASFQALRSALNDTTRANARAFIENGHRLFDAESVGFGAGGSKRFFSSNIIGIVINGYLLRLWGTQRDETERKIFEEQLESSRRQMRALVSRLQSLSEKERAGIARELHDSLGHGLTALKMDASWLSKRLPDAGAEGVRNEIAARLKEMTQLLEQTIAVVRNLSTELRPEVLDKFGLSAAVEWQCQEFARRTGLSCQCRLPKDELPLNTEHSTALFRILQEALTNVVRHAQAKSVKVDLRAADGLMTLVVRDDGRGVKEEELSAPASLGLLGMRERAEGSGGTFNVSKGFHGGTVVKASIPFDASEASPQQEGPCFALSS
ncbi:MAG TPA: PAS domain S-box protein [Pyrinomonadaceae bacterium]|jgi:PAS domain S-box-containing protein